MPTEERSPEPTDTYQSRAGLFSPPPESDPQEVPVKLAEVWSRWAASRLS
jgi:hypothetical protein